MQDIEIVIIELYIRSHGYEEYDFAARTESAEIVV